MAKEKTEPEKTGRIQQFRETYRMSKKTDPRIGLWILGAFLLVRVLTRVPTVSGLIALSHTWSVHRNRIADEDVAVSAEEEAVLAT